MLDLVPRNVRRILDLGTGDGRLLVLLRIDCPGSEGVALDFSPTMIEAARKRFHGEDKVKVIEHNLDEPLPDLGYFDAIVSSLTAADEDPSNKLVSVELQLRWLREIGFEDVDCCWKWLELALLSGVKGEGS